MTAATQDALDGLELEVGYDGEEGHNVDNGCSDASFLWSAASTAETGADAQYPGFQYGLDSERFSKQCLLRQAALHNPRRRSMELWTPHHLPKPKGRRGL